MLMVEINGNLVIGCNADEMSFRESNDEYNLIVPSFSYLSSLSPRDRNYGWNSIIFFLLIDKAFIVNTDHVCIVTNIYM